MISNLFFIWCPLQRPLSTKALMLHTLQMIMHTQPTFEKKINAGANQAYNFFKKPISLNYFDDIYK